MSRQFNQKGFTIVELLIVIVVIAILAAISIVAYTGIQNRAKASSSQSAASQLVKKAQAYYTVSTTSAYPAAIADFATYDESKLEGITPVLANGTNETTATAYADGKTPLYKQLTSTTACVYWWDFSKTTSQKQVMPLGGATTC